MDYKPHLKTDIQKVNTLACYNVQLKPNLNIDRVTNNPWYRTVACSVAAVMKSFVQ